MDNITYKIRNRDEISEQLVYIKVLTSEAERLRKFINKQEAKGIHEVFHLKTTACVRREVEVLKQKLYNVDLGDLL